MEFEVEVLLIELTNSNRQILALLQDERKLLQRILDRLPGPQVYPQTTGLAITVGN
jgi:hypothetical protein